MAAYVTVGDLGADGGSGVASHSLRMTAKGMEALSTTMRATSVQDDHHSKPSTTGGVSVGLQSDAHLHDLRHVLGLVQVDRHEEVSVGHTDRAAASEEVVDVLL